MKVLRLISRIITGIVFIFSGFVKAIDPLGTVYKFQDYFSAFNIGFLSDIALLLTIILCSVEFLAGFSVLFNIRQKTGIGIILLMMILFTPLTLVLALTNPVSDCGCFGDAIYLTNWQTFLKNVFILIPAIFLFYTRGKIVPHSAVIREWTILSIILLFLISFISYNLRYLPLIDFLPYKTGTYIPEKMITPEGKTADRYETTFLYEKDGVQKEFNLDNYPADDTTWHFVDQRSVLVEKGYQPPIHDLIMTAASGEDLTDQILHAEGYILLMISKKLEDCDPGLLDTGFEMGENFKNSNRGFYVLTASGTDIVNGFARNINFCLVDEITLKTMVRANPGYMLLKNGTIMGKWSWAGLPEFNELEKLMTDDRDAGN